jgi:hypothetical protein
MMKKIAFASAVLVTLAGCSSTTRSPENQSDQVVSRIDNLSSRPDWLRESEPFKIQNSQVVSLGKTTIPGDNRVEAAYRIAENNAKAAIASAIEQRLDFVFQNAEEGASVDANQTRYIGAEASKLTTSSLRLQNRYWEKVSTVQDNGQRVTQYTVFSTVVIPENDFKQAILEAIRKQQGKGGLSQDFSKKVEAHWEQFVNQSTPLKN